MWRTLGSVGLGSILLSACGGVVDADNQAPLVPPIPTTAATEKPPPGMSLGPMSTPGGTGSSPAPVGSSGFWGFPSDSNYATDAGVCAGVKLGVIADAARAKFPELARIQEYRSFGSEPVRSQIPQAIVAPSLDYFGGQVNADSVVVLVFYSGSGGCGTVSCRSESFWYFQTDTSCQPELVGRYQHTLSDDCYLGTGSPLWSIPEVDLLTDCSANLQPDTIEGTYLVHQVGKSAATSCAMLPLPADGILLVVSQKGADLSRGTVTLTGTTSSLIDGRAMDARIMQRNLTVQYATAPQVPCGPSVNIELLFNPDGHFVPGTVGELSMTATANPECSRTNENCDQELHMQLIDSKKLP